MHIYRHLDELPSSPGPAVATIGNFDGVHRGHRWVIENVLARARAAGLRSLVITFDPHPARAIRPGQSPQLITPCQQKLDLLSQTGVDEVLVLPFNGDLARMSAQQFAQEILRQKLNIVELHEGENFRFGRGAEAGIDTLKSLAPELGLTVFSYPPQHLHGDTVSSSRIRTLITAGDLAAARRLLGRPFSVRSTPASGRGYGTRYTVPTINLAPYPELLPAHGVYITQLRIGPTPTAPSGSDPVSSLEPAAETFDAVTNIGNRPTFGADSFTVESHLLNFHPIDLTPDTPLELCFLHRLRDEQRFPTPEALLAQIKQDVAKAQRYLGLLHRFQTSP